MKNKYFLSLCLSTLFAVTLSAQAPDTFQMNKNAPIQFLNKDMELDSTEIERKGGNSLWIRYNENPLKIRAFGDKPIQVKNADNETKIYLGTMQKRVQFFNDPKPIC